MDIAETNDAAGTTEPGRSTARRHPSPMSFIGQWGLPTAARALLADMTDGGLK